METPIEAPSDYREFAEECRRLAAKAEDQQHKAVLEQMAEVWSRLALEAEQERCFETLAWSIGGVVCKSSRGAWRNFVAGTRRGCNAAEPWNVPPHPAARSNCFPTTGEKA
jgi:hypothetical protein